MTPMRHRIFTYAYSVSRANPRTPTRFEKGGRSIRQRHTLRSLMTPMRHRRRDASKMVLSLWATLRTHTLPPPEHFAIMPISHHHHPPISKNDHLTVARNQRTAQAVRPWLFAPPL
eukprot:gene10531-biopygen1957